MDNRIRKFVYQIRGRLREQQIVTNLIKFVSYGLIAAVILSLISMVVPFYYAVPIAAGIVIFFFLAGIMIGMRKTPSPMKAALQADAKGHKEKISTAFYLVGKEDPFSTLQKRDALKIMDHFLIRKEFPLRISLKRALLVLGLALIFGISIRIDTPARRQANVQHDVSKEAKEEIARLEKVEKQLQENENLPAEAVGEIEKQLEQAKRELAEADSREELKKAEERITKKMEMASEDIKDKTVSEILGDAAKESRTSMENRDSELAQQAQKAMEKAENGSRSDKKEAYDKLSELADRLGDESLKEAAESYKDSSYSTSEYAKVSRTLDQTLQELQEAAISDYADIGDLQDGEAQFFMQGDSDDNPGQDGFGVLGQGEGDSPNEDNLAGKSSGDGWSKGSENGQEGPRRIHESITVPDGEIGNDENLTGKANSNGNNTNAQSNQSSAWSGNKISYGQVSGNYKEKAYKKVDGSNYPSKLKDRIKNYFNGLN